MEFARLSIEGMPVSKRKITPLIEEGKVTGFDDVRLPTLRGLKRRGILPEALKKFVLTQGISKVESVVSFGLVEAENRKIIDSFAKRLFFVPDPVKLTVSAISKSSIEIPYHPTNRSLGSRVITYGDIFNIPSDDMAALKVGDIFRLKDFCNIRVIEKNHQIKGEYVGTELIPESRKIQWTSKNAVDIEVIKPDLLFTNETFNTNSLSIIKGRVEPSVVHLLDGEIVQFERFGFVRLEIKDGSVTGFFTHR
jgi:glutamyl-tRNA synthetase